MPWSSEVGSTCALSPWLLTAQDPAVLLCPPENIMGQINSPLAYAQ